MILKKIDDAISKYRMEFLFVVGLVFVAGVGLSPNFSLKLFCFIMLCGIIYEFVTEMNRRPDK